MSLSLFSPDEKWSLIGLGLLAAAVVGAILWYAPKYDNPTSVSSEIPPKVISYHGVPGLLHLSCQCPPYLIQGKQQSLLFEVEIELTGMGTPQLPSQGEVIWWRFDAHAAGVDNGTDFVADGAEFVSARKATKNVELSLQAKDQDLSQISFHLATAPRGGGDYTSTLAAVAWPIASRAPFLHSLVPLAFAGLAFILVVGSVYLTSRKLRALDLKEREEFERAKLLAEKSPDQVSLFWEASSTNLQAYFKRNLTQIKWVFGVAVAVMLAGFFFVLWGVALSYNDPNHVTPTAKIATVSGLITQFIGATFMVIYRSTMAQANGFVDVLDRINTINVAMKVLDSIPESEIKNATRQQLVSLLISSRPTSRLPRTSKSAGNSSKDKVGSQPARGEG